MTVMRRTRAQMSAAWNKNCGSKCRARIRTVDFFPLYFQWIHLILGYLKWKKIVLTLPKIKLPQITSLELFCGSRQHTETWRKSPMMAAFWVWVSFAFDTSHMITANYFCQTVLGIHGTNALHWEVNNCLFHFCSKIVSFY